MIVEVPEAADGAAGAVDGAAVTKEVPEAADGAAGAADSPTNLKLTAF
jgi:hypothetical protein